MLKAVPTIDYYWTWVNPISDTLYDAEYADCDAAAEDALFWWGDLCEEEGGRNGEEREIKIRLLRYFLDDSGNMVFVEEKFETMIYEFYHGDKTEHGYFG